MDPSPPSKKLKADPTVRKRASTYQGYRFPNSGCLQVERINWQEQAVNSQSFYEQFVSQRKPCIIQNFPFPYDKSSAIQELQTMDTVEVQVEQRGSATERFGQCRAAKDRQITMSVADFLKRKSPMHYLSTQEMPDRCPAPNEPPETTPHMIPPPFFGPPCHRLRHLTRDLECAGNLRLASCHLWMGYADQTHSGLHHDFHDNFYMLLAGRKQFRIYSPVDAPFMAMRGEEFTVHFNGLISYQDNPSRPDGIPIVLDDKVGAVDDDGSEPECIIGKGFDYESDDEEDAEFEEGRDDLGDGSDNDDQSSGSSQSMPNHFSWIDPTTEKDLIVSTYPLFQNATECSLDLASGDLLYLPASWFHCVTSHQTEADNLHMAVNYWYYPPDQLNDFERPYIDEAFRK